MSMYDVERPIEGQCKRSVSGEGKWGAFHQHQCTRPIWKDGYCKQHHPDKEEERRAKRREEARRKSERLWNNSPINKLNQLRERTQALVSAAEALIERYPRYRDDPDMGDLTAWRVLRGAVDAAKKDL